MSPSEYLLYGPPQGPETGKCGPIVRQRARYGQICYPAFIPVNPRTPAQVAVRLIFAAVSARWRTLTQQQRDIWIAVARTKKSRLRLGQCGPLTGFNYFVQLNVRLANRGQPQLDLSPEFIRFLQRAVPGRFDQLPIGPTQFLQANQLVGDWHAAPGKFAAPVPPPA
jgi:hypothetical protein